MYLIKNRFLVKTAVTVLTIVSLAGGMLPQQAKAESTQIYVQSTTDKGSDIQKNIGYLVPGVTEENVNERLTKLLGTLDKKVSADERKNAFDILTKIVSLEKLRREEKVYNPSDLENLYMTRLNKYLNELTIKYFPDAKKIAEELEDAYVPAPSVKNPIIENIKSVLSKKDYQKIKKLYQNYVKNNEDIGQVADDMYEILEKYKSLNVEAVVFNIFTADNGTVAQFTINTSKMTLKYQDPTGTGIKKLTKKQITKYKQAWKELRKIIPDSMLKNFKEFDISTDGKYGVLAFVQNIDEKGKTWKISIDPADMENKIEFANTVIHEYGHYLSLNNTQATYIDEKTDEDSVIDDFDLYREPSMVTKKNSYLNQFYNKYWKDFASDRDINASSQLFYFRHSNQFIDTYASTSCAEDFAECFSFYVLPSGEKLTKEQQEKLDFFDQFKEMKEAKTQILSNMKKNNIIK